MLATALLKGFHPLAPAIFLVIVAAVLVLAFAAPVQTEIDLESGNKGD